MVAHWRHLDQRRGVRRYWVAACCLWLLGCASEALSLEPPNVVEVTPQPSIIAIGESVTIDFYPQRALPEGELGPSRLLDPSPFEELGMVVEEWSFRTAFDFSVSLIVTEKVERGIFPIELSIENEYERFLVRFSLQVTQ